MQLLVHRATHLFEAVLVGLLDGLQALLHLQLDLVELGGLLFPRGPQGRLGGRREKPESIGQLFRLGGLEIAEFGHQGPELRHQRLLGLHPVAGGQFLPLAAQGVEGRGVGR